MTERVRVYHPETDEPFDVPKAKADELRLNKGWRSQPLDPSAQPLVTEVETERGPAEAPDDWRDTEVGQEIDEDELVPPPTPRRNFRKS